MAGVGEQRFLRGDEALDAGGGGVEGAGDHRDLVVAGIVHPQRQPSRAPCLDPRAQIFEPPSEARRGRIGGEADGRGDAQNHRKKVQSRAPAGRAKPRQHRPAVGEVDAKDRRPDRLARRTQRDRRSARGDQRSLGVIDRHVRADRVVQPAERGGDGARRFVASGHIKILEPDAQRAPMIARRIADQRPEGPHQKRDRDEARKQRQVDLPEQPPPDEPHAASSCLFAKT